MDELEELREENHRLNLRLDSIRQSSGVEVDYLKEELLLKEREHKEQLDKLISDSKNRELALQEQIAALNEDLNLSREEVDKLKEQNETMKANLDHLKARNNEAMNRRSNAPINLDHLEALKDSLDEKEKALTRANETISSQSERLREYNDIMEVQRGRIVEIIEELETKQVTILEQQERIRQIEIERNEQVQQQQQQVLEKCDNTGKSRGNSLFSEVEERRVRVEEELRRLRDRVARLTRENIDLRATVERGDNRNTAVSNQLQTLERSEQEMIKEIKKLKNESFNLFDSYRERMESLRREYHRRLSQYKTNGVSIDLGLEKLTEERDQLILAKMTLERDFFECKKDLKYTKHMKTECETHLKILRIKMQEQNDKKSKRTSAGSNREENSSKNDSVEDATTPPDASLDVENHVDQKDSKSVEEINECKTQ